jgi:ABC-type multidrug transport system fused ATPase/permease subunit
VIFHRFKIYWSLVLKHPLYFINAYIAAILTNYLLTLQPGFLKVFINEATKGSLKEHLLVITYFMIGALLLAFIFDTIQVSTSMLFKINIEKKLRLIHYRYAKNRSLKDISFPIQRGIFGLTEFCLLTSLDFLISITNIAIVLFFIFSSNPTIGAIVGFLVVTLLLATFPTIKKLGKISKEKEKIKTKCIAEYESSNISSYEKYLNDIQRKESKRFKHDTVLVFSSFLIFKLTPSFILFAYIFQKNNNYGELASLFLYFGLLYGPYKKMTSIIKQSTLFFTQAEIFKDDIEQAIKIDKILKKLPTGVVCIIDECFPSSNHNEQVSNSTKELKTFRSNNFEDISKSDFVLTQDLRLMTTPKYLLEKKSGSI